VSDNNQLTGLPRAFRARASFAAVRAGDVSATGELPAVAVPQAKTAIRVYGK
jgi:hypothetical protein